MASYRSALLANKPIIATTYWEKPEKPEPLTLQHYDHSCFNPAYTSYHLLLKLRIHPTFRKLFADFAENILCITNTDTEKGLRLDSTLWNSIFMDGQVYNGQHKKYLPLFLVYKQDGMTWSIAYECDILEDPSTGMFNLWVHKDDCCGLSCSFYQCHMNYKTNNNTKTT